MFKFYLFTEQKSWSHQAATFYCWLFLLSCLNGENITKPCFKELKTFLKNIFYYWRPPCHKLKFEFEIESAFLFNSTRAQPFLLNWRWQTQNLLTNKRKKEVGIISVIIFFILWLLPFINSDEVFHQGNFFVDFLSSQITFFHLQHNFFIVS